MSRLKIIAPGQTEGEKADARGRLFEELCAKVLRHEGYEIDRTPRVNYAGMEIDIEGRHRVSDTPLYAECKCHATEVDAPRFQTFYGKYMARWHRDPLAQGLFLALPGINSHAVGFYNENCRDEADMTLILLQEEQVLHAVCDANDVERAPEIAARVTADEGTPGDATLLYTPSGLFWVQNVIPPGSGLATAALVFDGRATRISDPDTLALIVGLVPELSSMNILNVAAVTGPLVSAQASEEEQVAEVQRSSSCFEYQYPAAPEFFVGREKLLFEVEAYAQDVANKRTSTGACCSWVTLVGEKARPSWRARSASGRQATLRLPLTVGRLRRHSLFSGLLTTRCVNTWQWPTS